MSDRTSVAGWDLGGAHLKLALADGRGRLTEVAELPCPLWQGLDRLEDAIAQVRPLAGPARRHAITMTGELVDLFDDRRQGVERLVESMGRCFPSADLRFYAGPRGLLDAGSAVECWEDVASANWLASVGLAARAHPQGLFLDVGSTTTDIVAFRGGEPRSVGMSDPERLASGELLYSGVTRTPLMALAQSVPFDGVEQGVMAEIFATTADVYLLSGDLGADADTLPSADGGEKSSMASARRLARMLGRDAAASPPAAWRRLAGHFAELQKQLLHRSCDRVLSRGLLDQTAPLLGAGLGRFLVCELARRLDRPYLDFGELVEGDDRIKDWAARCAPAAALALSASTGCAGGLEP